MLQIKFDQDWPTGLRDTVKREIFALSNFRGISHSINLRKLKSAKYFWKINVEELVMYMVAVYGSYLFACGKTSNMELSQSNLSLQAIWLEINWSMTDLIYSRVMLINFRLLSYSTYM